MKNVKTYQPLAEKHSFPTALAKVGLLITTLNVSGSYSRRSDLIVKTSPSTHGDTLFEVIVKTVRDIGKKSLI